MPSPLCRSPGVPCVRRLTCAREALGRNRHQCRVCAIVTRPQQSGWQPKARGTARPIIDPLRLTMKPNARPNPSTTAHIRKAGAECRGSRCNALRLGDRTWLGQPTTMVFSLQIHSGIRLDAPWTGGAGVNENGQGKYHKDRQHQLRRKAIVAATNLGPGAGRPWIGRERGGGGGSFLRGGGGPQWW